MQNDQYHMHHGNDSDQNTKIWYKCGDANLTRYVPHNDTYISSLFDKIGIHVLWTMIQLTTSPL